MRTSFKLLATTAILTFMAGTANAATNLKFVLTGGYDATWTLPASPVPSDEQGFVLEDVPGIWNGESGVRRLVFLIDGDNTGTLMITRRGIGNITLDFRGIGGRFFTGTGTASTFQTGAFLMTTFSPNTIADSTLTISAQAVIPEPATWAMLIAGFGLVGIAARRRRETEVTA